MKKVTKLGALLFGLVLAGTCMTTSGCSSKVSAEEALKEAGGYVWSMYYDHNVTTKTGSFDVVTHAMYEGCDVQVDWALEITKGVKTGAIELKKTDDKNTDTIYVGYYDGLVTEATEFQLVPTFSYDGKSMKLADIVGAEKAVFKYKTPVFVLNNHDQWLAEGSSGTNVMNIKGVVLDVLANGSGKGSFYFQDAEGFGYYAYNPSTTDAVKAGDVVAVTGKRSDYSGQQEFAKECTFHVYEGETQDVIIHDATADWKGWASTSAYTDKYQNNYVELKNCKATKVDGTYYYFTVDGGKTEYNIYDNYYFLSDAQRNEFKLTWSALQATGEKFTIQGITTVYSSKIQVYGSTKLPTVFKGVEMNDKLRAAATVAEAKAQFAESYTEDKDIALAAKGTSFDTATIAYEVVSPTQPNEFVKIEDGKLKIKIDASYSEIKVKITATIGAESSSETIKIKTSLTYTTIADLFAGKDKDTVQYLHGYVVAADGNHDTEGSFVLDDGTETAFSYNKFKVALGDEVIISATYGENGGLPQIATKALVKVISSDNAYTGPISGEITSANIETIKNDLKQTDKVYNDATKAAAAIEAYFGHIVKATGYLVAKTSGTKTYYNLYAENSNTSTQIAQLYFTSMQSSIVEGTNSLVGQKVDVYGFARTFTSNGIKLQAQAIVANGTAHAEKIAPQVLAGYKINGVTGNDLDVYTKFTGFEGGNIYNFPAATKITNSNDFGEIDHVEVVIISTYTNNLPQVKAAATADGLKTATKLGDYEVANKAYVDGKAPVKVADVAMSGTYKAAQYTFTYTPAAGCHYFEISAESSYAFQVSAINVYYK